MKAKETKELVELFYKLLADDNTDSHIELLADDIEWNIPGNEQLAPWTGKKKSEHISTITKNILKVSFSM